MRDPVLPIFAMALAVAPLSGPTRANPAPVSPLLSGGRPDGNVVLSSHAAPQRPANLANDFVAPDLRHDPIGRIIANLPRTAPARPARWGAGPMAGVRSGGDDD